MVSRSDPSDVPTARLISIERALGGGPVYLTFDQDVDRAAVGRFLFGDGVPDGVEITVGTAEVGYCEVAGVTWDVVRQMRADVAHRVASAPEIDPSL